MSTERGLSTRRAAVVVARHSAAHGSPPGIVPQAFADACLADTYEVVADLVGVTSGIVSAAPEAHELLWPGALRLAVDLTPAEIVAELTGDFDEVVLVPADVPDLPGLVLAKVFKALQRADVCVAPERGAGSGCVALGLRVPWPEWISVPLDLDVDPREALQRVAARRNQVSVGPDWHRMRTPAAIQRLDPGLEGWEMTRALLAGHALSAPVTGDAP